MGFESLYKLSVVMNMIDNLSSPMQGVTNKVMDSVSKVDALSSSFGGMTQAGTVISGLGVQITEGVLAPVAATFETKKALGELASLGIEDLGAIENAAKSFSDTWAGTTKPEFISAAYDIKSGISSLSDTGVAEYTKLSALTGTATKSSVGEMTNLFATGYGIYKDYYKDMSDIEFGEMFSAGISKSVQAFKTTGSGMAQSIQTLGSSATTSQVPLEEQLSILGMLQATMSGSEAGTKYKAFLRSATKGGEALGLSFTDANDQLLSMPEILGMLKGKFGDTMDAAEKMDLQKAFGDTEAVSLIENMYSKTGVLQDNILTLYDTMGQGVGVATQMADAINSTEPAKFEALKQSIHNVAADMGNTLLPTINDYMGKAGAMIKKADDWIANNQELVGIIMKVVLILGVFLTVGGAAIGVIGGVGLIFSKTAGLVGGFIKIAKGVPGIFQTMQIKALYAGDSIHGAFIKIKSGGAIAISGIKNVAGSIASFAKTAVVSGITAAKNFVIGMAGMAKQAVTTAVTAMPGLITSVWGFTAALLANPITWIVIAIVALIVGLILLWQNWDSVVAFIKGVWSGFINGITAGIDWLVEKFAMVGEFFGNLGNNIKTAFVTGIENVKTFIMGIPAWFKESGAKIITTFTDGIKSVISKPVEAIKGGLQKIRNMLPFSDAKEGPLNQLTLSGKKVLQTVSTGIKQSENLPAEAVSRSFSKIDLSATQKPANKENSNNMEKSASTTQESNSETQKKYSTVTQNFHLQVDWEKIKDIKSLLNLLKEMEDLANSNGGDEPVPEPA